MYVPTRTIIDYKHKISSYLKVRMFCNCVRCCRFEQSPEAASREAPCTPGTKPLPLAAATPRATDVFRYREKPGAGPIRLQFDEADPHVEESSSLQQREIQVF